MTYVREQSSEELAAHMRSLQRMAGWFDPLADRLWQEVEKLKAEVARSTEREIYQLAEIEALRKALAECTSSLEGEVLQKYHGQKPEDMHPVTRRDYDRDMEEINGYKSMSKEKSL